MRDTALLSALSAAVALLGTLCLAGRRQWRSARRAGGQQPASSRVCLEVCVDSLLSAQNAEQGGATAIELCDNLGGGGTTPSIGKVEAVLRHPKLVFSASLANELARTAEALYARGDAGGQLYAAARGLHECCGDVASIAQSLHSQQKLVIQPGARAANRASTRLEAIESETSSHSTAKPSVVESRVGPVVFPTRRAAWVDASLEGPRPPSLGSTSRSSAERCRNPWA